MNKILNPCIEDEENNTKTGTMSHAIYSVLFDFTKINRLVFKKDQVAHRNELGTFWQKD